MGSRKRQRAVDESAMGQQVKAYWWAGESGRHILNWGDALTDTLLNSLQVAHEWSMPEDADIVLTGSILEHLPDGWQGTVVGAGKLREHSDIRVRLRHANVLAVRGPLTVRHLKGDIALGDPGLLASDLVMPRQAAFDLGVVPHWSDNELIHRFPNGHHIKANDGALWVLNEISKCRRIVSSSLHGIIAADALGIPRQAELFDGSAFKWRDYSASINMEPEFGHLVLANSNRVEERQKEIRDAIIQATSSSS